MSDQVLEQLFESDAKIKLLKLFLRNQGSKFTPAEVRERAQIDLKTARNVLERLRKAGFLKSYSKKVKVPAKTVTVKNSKVELKKVGRRVKEEAEKVYFINSQFVFFKELRDLVLKSSPASKSKVMNRVQGVGRVKMLVLSGIFMRPERDLSRSDIFMVVDDLSEKRFARFLKNLEAEAGCEIQYSIMTSEEFAYRRTMMDRFLRDILERPHEVLINKLGA